MTDIKNSKIEIIVKDTKSDPEFTLKSANELKQQGVNLTIGPVFFINETFIEPLI